MSRENPTEILNNLSRIFDQENVRVTRNSDGKIELISGLCTIAGGFFGGRFGIALGLAGTAMCMLSNSVPLSEVIQKKLNINQQSSLVNLIKNFLQIGSIPTALAGIMSNQGIRTAVINIVLSFIRKEKVQW